MYNLSKISKRSFGLIKNNISTLSVVKKRPKFSQNHDLQNSKIPQTRFFIGTRYCQYNTGAPLEIDGLFFEKVCEETLQSLTDFFEELVERNDKLESADISYSVRIYINLDLIFNRENNLVLEVNRKKFRICSKQLQLMLIKGVNFYLSLTFKSQLFSFQLYFSLHSKSDCSNVLKN